MLGLFADAATEGAGCVENGPCDRVSVRQQLDCTIKAFRIGHLHRGWVEQQSEAWKSSADRQWCGTIQNNIFLFVLRVPVLVAEANASDTDARSWLSCLCWAPSPSLIN